MRPSFCLVAGRPLQLAGAGKERGRKACAEQRQAWPRLTDSAPWRIPLFLEARAKQRKSPGRRQRELAPPIRGRVLLVFVELEARLRGETPGPSSSPPHAPRSVVGPMI